jgi:hypothetical protein
LPSLLHWLISPTSLPILMLIQTVESWLTAPVTGTFQLTGPRDVSYAEAADYIARKLDADPGLVQRVSAYGAGLPEGSTARNTTLDSSAVAERYGIVVPDGYVTPVSIRPAVDTATSISWCPEDDDGEHASRAGRKTMPGLPIRDLRP